MVVAALRSNHGLTLVNAFGVDARGVLGTYSARKEDLEIARFVRGNQLALEKRSTFPARESCA